MGRKLDLKLITIFLAIAVIFVSIAFLTITSTFAFPDKLLSKQYNIAISDIESSNVNKNDVQIRKNSILFNIHLNNSNKSNSFVATIENYGNIDATLMNMSKQNINDIFVFNYKDKDYYLSDIVNFTIMYSETNKENKIILNSEPRFGDLYLNNTKNKIEVMVRFKKDNELNKQTKEALNYFFNENKSIDRSLSINMSFTDK